MNPYLICSIGRSGTNYLKHVLYSQGLGFPSEHNFEKHPIANREDLHRTSLEDRYADSPVWARTLWYKRVEEMVKAIVWAEETYKHSILLGDRQIIEHVFPEMVYFYLFRENILQQAISFEKANQSGEWTRRNKTEIQEFAYRYKPERIIRYLKDSILRDDFLWKKWFATQGIVPLYITYESLINDTSGVCDLVATAIRAEDYSFSQDALDMQLSKPSAPVKQADTVTIEWECKFLEMYGPVPVSGRMEWVNNLEA